MEYGPASSPVTAHFHLRPPGYVATWLVLFFYPVPRIRNLQLQIGSRGCPAQKIARTVSVADQDRRVAPAARRIFHADASTSHALRSDNNLFDPVTTRVLPVECAALTSTEQAIKGA